MRLICGVAGTVVAAVLAVSAHALDLPPLPVPPLPPLPTLPVPTPPAPTLPAPPVPAPPVPTVPTPAPTPTPTPPTTPAPAPPVPSPAPATPQAQPQPAAATGRGTAIPSAHDIWARHPAKRRLLGHFRLAHAGRVLVSVRELAPVCRTLGRYRLKARKGSNALHLPARIKRPGSYAFVGRVHGRKVFSVEARVGKGRRVLLGATTASVCPAPVVSVISLQTGASPAQLHVKGASTQRVSPKAIGSSPRGGSPLIRAVSLTDAPASVRPLLFTLLALAIFFLATAAAPQRLLPAGRAAAVVAQQRVYLAAAGISLLVAVAVVTALA